jgi:SAM-dependent methyltransferase
VTGLDLTAEYCEVASMLARSTGRAHLVGYQQGDALHAPFEDQAFDVVWTQHASMNIEDKPALYREIFRLLKKGGRLAVHDVVAGAGVVHYPVPWARRPELSFLISHEEMRSAFTATGFRAVVSQDVTYEGIEALRQVASRASSSAFGIQTLMGVQFPLMIANLSANLQSGSCRLVQATCVNM